MTNDLVVWVAEEVPVAVYAGTPPAGEPVTQTSYATESHARGALADRLDSLSTMRARLGTPHFGLYRSAADTIRHGAQAVQIDGRVFRIRLTGIPTEE